MSTFSGFLLVLMALVAFGAAKEGIQDISGINANIHDKPCPPNYGIEALIIFTGGAAGLIFGLLTGIFSSEICNFIGICCEKSCRKPPSND